MLTMMLIPARHMLNTAVRSPAGEVLGTLRDFVFDDTLTRVTHAIVVRGTETHEIPLERMLLDTEDECFIVDRRKRRS
jgi:sporulation protein YlmC with PRC-barrel domain